MSAQLDNDPCMSCSLHLPMSGAWSAELQVARDVELTPGDQVTLYLPGATFQGSVVRAGIFADRMRVRLTGGAADWSFPVELKHYRKATVDDVLADLGLEPDEPVDVDLPFWVRKHTTIGESVRALAELLQVNWRVNPDGSLRIRAEDPETVNPQAVEISRDAARGIVEIAPDVANVLPGCQVGEDLVGDVIYEVSEDSPLRCRYYTEARGRLRGTLERLIRWVMRDALYLGTYSALVVRQAADGTLDVLPDDERLRAGGLQAVPIRHGLPGVEVDVPAGERVLLAFDAGDPRKPYAALWHAGQVTAVRIGGTEAVALATLVEEQLVALKDAISDAPVVAQDGGASFKAALVASLETWPASTAAEKLFTE